MNDRRFPCMYLGLLSLCLAIVTPAFAVSEGAPASRALLMVQSARASGMGQVTAVLDEAATGIWWNPGMAALDRRAQFNYTNSDLAQGLARDINMKQYTLNSGHIPVGPVSVSGGFAYAKLNLGSTEVIDESGNLLRTFSSYDKLYNIFLGVSWRGMVGLGYVREYTKSHLAPAIVELGIDEGTGKIWGNSFGIGVKPVVRFDMESREVALWEEMWSEERSPGIAFSPIFSWSYLHKGEDIVYSDQNQAEPQPKQSHLGYGFKLRVDAGTTGELIDWHRLLSFEFLMGWEKAKSEVDSPKTVEKAAASNNENDTIDLDGWELRFGGILSIRRGNIDDEEGNIIDSTDGWGIGIEGLFPIGIRYDKATIPQASGLPTVDRKEFMLTADVMKLIALMRE